MTPPAGTAEHAAIVPAPPAALAPPSPPSCSARLHGGGHRPGEQPGRSQESAMRSCLHLADSAGIDAVLAPTREGLKVPRSEGRGTPPPVLNWRPDRAGVQTKICGC